MYSGLGGGGRGGWTLLALALIGRISIACSFAILSAGGSAELLPAPYRALISTIFVTIARIVLSGVPFLNSLVSYRAFYLLLLFVFVII
jgi:hypothetical protein